MDNKIIKLIDEINKSAKEIKFGNIFVRIKIVDGKMIFAKIIEKERDVKFE